MRIKVPDSQKNRGTVKYFIQMYLRHMRNLPEVQMDPRKLLQIHAVEKQMNEMGITSVAIDPENYHVYLNPSTAGFRMREKYCVEGTDNFFYPYGLNSPYRMSEGLSQGRHIMKARYFPEEYRKRFLYTIKKIGSKVWNRFLRSLTAEQKETARKMMGPRFSISVAVSPYREHVQAFLIAKGLQPLLEEKDFDIYTDLSTLFAVMDFYSVFFYTWPGYLDLHAPMKYVGSVRYSENCISQLMRFFRDIPRAQ